MPLNSAQDQDARDAITTDLDANFFVEAGAGSGKTANLVLRLVNLTLRKPVGLSHIAAITFTEAAAGELRNRLRQAFAQIAATGTLTGPDGRTLDYAGYEEAARRAMTELPGAAIGTLHSFCLRIIQAYPLEAGVPPRIQPAPSGSAAAQHPDHLGEIVEFVESVVTGSEPHLAELDALGGPGIGSSFYDAVNQLLLAGMTTDKLATLISHLDENWGDLQPTIAAPLPEESQGLTAADVRLALDRLQRIAQTCTNPTDKLYADRYAPGIEMLESAVAGLADADLVTCPFDVSARSRGAAKNWADVQAARDTFAEVSAHLEEQRQAPVRYATALVRRVLAQLVVDRAARRRRRGELEFHDMIYIADTLVTNPAVRDELHAQYRHIFVDEFQDTDPAQYRIIRAITGNGGEPVPGSLFIVGDPKQSIYRFRRADIATYLNARPTDGSTAILNTNYRSAQSVLDPINALFSELFAGADQAERIAYDELRAGRDMAGRAYFIDHRNAVSEAGQKPDYGAEEAADIVAALRCVQEGRFRRTVAVSHEQGGGTETTFEERPLTLKDVTILAPTRTVTDRVIEVLRAHDIPLRAEKTFGLFQAPEITDLMQVIRAVSDPADAFAQAAALRSATLGVSDTELAAWSLERGAAPAGDSAAPDPTPESPAAPDPAPETPAAQAVDRLRQWRNAARTQTVGAVVRQIIADTALDQAMVAWGKPDSITRLRAFAQAAENYSAETCGTLREFVAWVASEARGNSEISDPVLDLGGDAVNVMTIHNSKGREFPMVILAGMSSRPASQRSFCYFHPATKILEVELVKGTGSEDYVAAKEADKQAAEAESIRLNYVAMTRAENVLVVPLTGGLTKAKKNTPPQGSKIFRAAPYLTYMAQHEPAQFMTREQAFPDLPSAGGDSPDRPTPSAAAPEPAERRVQTTADYAERFRARRAALDQASAYRPRIAATAIAHAPTAAPDAQLGEEYLLKAAVLADAPDFTAASAPVRGTPLGTRGASFGTAVHAAMEQLATSADPQLDRAALCENVSRAYGIAAVDDLRAAVDSLANSATYQRVSGARSYSELPVIGQVALTEAPHAPQQVAVDGVIDVLYQDGDDWVIADYKTDASATSETVAAYFAQLYIYSRLLGIPVSRLELVFARPGAAEERVVRLS